MTPDEQVKRLVPRKRGIIALSCMSKDRNDGKTSAAVREGYLGKGIPFRVAEL